MDQEQIIMWKSLPKLKRFKTQAAQHKVWKLHVFEEELKVHIQK